MTSNTHSNFKSLTVFAVACSTCFFLGGLYSRYTTQSWPFSGSIDLASKEVGHDHGENGGSNHDDSHAGHDHSAHDHEGHTETNSLELSESAKKNLGLTEEYLTPIELQSFQRSIAVPAVVVDRPGRTRLPVSASMTGIVTHVHAVAGEAIRPGDLILEMRLTHEDLVTAQKDYLQSLGDRDIEVKEISRLEGLANTGAISTKTLLERQYSKDKIDSLLRSQREALRLHGLSDLQINKIESNRRLLTEIRILAPRPDTHSDDEIQLSRQLRPKFGTKLMHPAPPLGATKQQVSILTVGFHDPNKVAEKPSAPHLDSHSVDQHSDDPHSNDPHRHESHLTTDHLLVLQELLVQKGQIVNAGELLCTLADYSDLLIEGQAFESEAGFISKAKLNDWKVGAIADIGGESTQLSDLEFGWVNNEIDPATRILKFYVGLPNVLMQDSQNPNGQRFISWKFRTGQRVQLMVPIEKWEDQIVLPVDAVIREGVDSYVFQQNGDHFDRVAVHERYRDQMSVVVENDGSIYPGDVVARRGAHQMQMALKNKSGGAVDPHAGHNH